MDLQLIEVQSFVSDLGRAKSFYEGTLGFKKKHEGEGWIIFDLQGIEFIIQSGATPVNSEAEYVKRCGTMLVLKTEDIEQAVKALKADGVELLGEIKSVLQGKFIGFKDPDGNLIELAQQAR